MFKNKKLLSSVACATLLACVTPALSYETTTFNVSLSDPALTGTFSAGNSVLSDGTTSITAGANTYDYAYQYFTPSVSGTYVFGQLTAPSDTVILLYSPIFSEADPTINFISMNDDGDVSSIADSALRAYVSTAISGTLMCGSPTYCPLLEANLSAGTDYYIVVSTYDPATTVGTSGLLEFFVIGDALVGVGGVPAVTPTPGAGYVETSAPTPVSNLATYLDANDGSGDLATVATYLNSASSEEVQQALKEIFPVNSTVNTQLTMNATGQTATVLIDKVGTVLGSMDTPSAAGFADGSSSTSQWIFGQKSIGMPQRDLAMGFAGSSNTSINAPDSMAGFASIPYQKYKSDDRAFWIQGVGGLTNGDATSLTNGYDSRTAGVVSGYEFALNESNLVGVIVSGFRSYVDIDNNAGETDASTYSLGLYGQHLFGSLKLTGVVLGSYSNYDSERNIDIGGVLAEPKSDYNGWGTSSTISLSQLFEHNDIKIEPFLSGNFSTASSEGYDETGGGAFNMSVGSDTSSTASAKTGVTFQYDMELADTSTLGFKVKPYVGYQWELEEASNAIRLSGATASTVVNGRDIDTAQVGLALEAKYALPSGNSFKFGVDASHDKNDETGIAYVGYGIKF